MRRREFPALRILRLRWGGCGEDVGIVLRWQLVLPRCKRSTGAPRATTAERPATKRAVGFAGWFRGLVSRLASRLALRLEPRAWTQRDLPSAGSRTGHMGYRAQCRCGGRGIHSNQMLNRGYAYTTILSGKCQGQTLLTHLARLYPHSTLEAWQQNLNNGEVTLDGVIARGSEWIASGQRLVWNRPPWVEPDAPRHFEVLFEDAHLLAVNKPSGLPTLPGGGFMENTLLGLVQKQAPEANPVHRLGRGTSGIVLFAKTRQAASILTANWNTQKVQKIYRALAQNIAERDEYEILTPIGLAPHPRLGHVWAASVDDKAGGKPSRSVAKVMARSAGGTGGAIGDISGAKGATTGATAGATIFEVSLHSGRPHQIRIHLAFIGHPLVGDPLYGAGGQPLEDLPGLPGDGGYLLHAQNLRFEHPITGEQVHLEAGLPSDWRSFPTAMDQSKSSM